MTKIMMYEACENCWENAIKDEDFYPKSYGLINSVCDFCGRVGFVKIVKDDFKKLVDTKTNS